ncbi:MAG: hypothetical protein WC606_02150 [Candidatus Absconditabacterales bacterium]
MERVITKFLWLPKWLPDDAKKSGRKFIKRGRTFRWLQAVYIRQTAIGVVNICAYQDKKNSTYGFGTHDEIVNTTKPVFIKEKWGNAIIIPVYDWKNTAFNIFQPPKKFKFEVLISNFHYYFHGWRKRVFNCSYTSH